MGGQQVIEEQTRLQELASYQILGTDPEPIFDDLAEVVRIRFDTPIAIISFVGEKDVFFKAHPGTDLQGAPREATFCNETLASVEPVIVYDAEKEEGYRHKPFVTGDPFVQFYAGARILTSSGAPIGVVCAIDTISRSPAKSDVEFLRGVASLAMSSLEMRRQSKELLEIANQFGSITERMDAVREQLDERCARSLARIIRQETS